MWYDLNASPLIEENRRALKPRTLFSVFIAFFILTIVTDFAVGIPMTFFLMFRIAGDFSDVLLLFTNNDITGMEAYVNEVASESGYLLASLLSTAAGILVLLLFAFLIEKRSPYSLGFTKKNAVLLYSLGFLSGIALLAASVGVSLLNGSVSLSLASEVSPLWIFLFLLGFLVQGAFEEILLRGVFFPALLRHFSSPLIPCIDARCKSRRFSDCFPQHFPFRCIAFGSYAPHGQYPSVSCASQCVELRGRLYLRHGGKRTSRFALASYKYA